MKEVIGNAYVPYEVLPEARDWRVGKNYRAKMVMKQTGADQHGANFNVIDGTSLERNEARRRYFLSDGGTFRG